MKTLKAQKAAKPKVVPARAARHHKPEKKIRRLRTPAKQATPHNAPTPITHEMISQRAKSIWIFKGCVPGQDEANWLQAEVELNLAQNRKKGLEGGASL